MTTAQRLPSLLGRITAVLVGSFAVVFVVLFTWAAWGLLARDNGELDRGLMLSALSVAGALDAIGDEARAGSTALALLRELQQRDLSGEPPLHLAITRADGSVVLHSGVQPDAAMLGVADGAHTPPGSRWRVYAATGRNWRVLLIDGDDAARRRWLAWSIATDLALNIAMAIPFVLLPLWGAARLSLRPLRRLSAAVAARQPLDTTPLPAGARRWRELAPLEDSLNRLFERTAQGVAREKAFVHDAAHELRTPLAVIAAQAHLLATSEGAARTEAAGRLQSAVERASHLSQQLLQLAQADGAVRSPPQPLDLMDLVRDAMSLHAARADAQGTELSLEGPDQLPMRSDARTLRAIIDNLLDNALRHGGAGGAVRVRVAAAEHQLTLEVADSGPGIAAADAEQVFERFWRGNASDGRGTGLGLAIVRGASHSLGGEVALQRPGPGAAFVLTLPLPGPRA
jgi:two-component system, OmpR family, sensor histidine kinase QseC